MIGYVLAWFDSVRMPACFSAPVVLKRPHMHTEPEAELDASKAAGQVRRICLLSADLNNPNRGVVALSLSLIRNIVDICPSARICFLYSGREHSMRTVNVAGRSVRVEVLNWRLSPRASLTEHLYVLALVALLQRAVPVQAFRARIISSFRRLQALHESDWVGDIRGGDSFSDLYGAKAFLIGSLPALIALWLGKPLVLLPQTIGPFKSSCARRVASLLLSGAKRIYVRDHESVAVIDGLMAGRRLNARPEFCPDVAFKLDAILPEKPDIQPPLPAGKPEPLIGLNISALLYIGGYSEDNMFGLRFDYKQFIGNLVARLLKQTDARVLLVPHHYGPAGIKHSDLTSSRDFLTTLASEQQSRVHLVAAEYGPRELKGIIGQCDFFIGSRMHACIAAASQGVPTVALAYSRKFVGVFDSIGAGHMVLDARQVSEDEAIAEILRRYRIRERYGELLPERIGSAQMAVTRVFQGLLTPHQDVHGDLGFHCNLVPEGRIPIE